METDRQWAVDGVNDETIAPWRNASPPRSSGRCCSKCSARERDNAHRPVSWSSGRAMAFVRLSPVDQRTTMAVETEVLAAAAQFEAVELSPLAPLGVCSVVGLASQNKIVSALRGTEVVSDPTNVLALECARRLRDRGRGDRSPGHVSPCRARPTGAQAIGVRAALPDFLPGQWGPRAEGPGVRCRGALHPHRDLRAALDRLERAGFSFPNRRLALLATPERASLADRIAGSVFGAEVERRPLDHPYYAGLRYMLWCGEGAGGGVPLIDGGAFDWMGTLTANRKMVFVASGMGSQLVPILFRP